MKVTYNDQPPVIICAKCEYEITGLVWGKGVCYDCHDTWTCACLCDERCDCGDNEDLGYSYSDDDDF